MKKIIFLLSLLIGFNSFSQTVNGRFPDIKQHIKAGFVTPEDYGAKGDGSTNDATALQNAINSGYQVKLGNKTYLTNTALSVSDNSSISGSGKLSILKTTSNVSILSITGSSITIDGVTFLGNATGTSQNGISAIGNAGFTLYRVNIKVSNCNFISLGGFGMYTTLNIGLNSGNEHQGTFYATNCFFASCYIGVGLYERGEYNTFSNCVISKCTFGFVNNAGNNTFIGGQIVDCATNGVTIGTGVNDGHGSMVGTKINHNGYNVSVNSVVTNFTFANCMFYVGIISVITANGIKFHGCEFSVATYVLTNNVQLEFSNCKFTVAATTYSLTGTPPVYNNCYHLDSKKAATAKVFYSELTTLSANGTFTVPAGMTIESIVFENTTANAVTGGIRIGSTNGGAEVVTAKAVGANEIVQVTNAELLIPVFSSSVQQILYIQAVTAWNSASVKCYIKLKPLV